ncbi:hypothetical protein ACIQF6_35745 [Kitasatospora sp. NPDC092948]|uniref:hypothetical protein n=1 Tax=Kitasatospora sp. NPDC092948 TaxID=3364088 RepID=UPI00380D12E1
MSTLPLNRLEDLASALGHPWQVAPDPFDGHADYRRFVAGSQGRGFWLSIRQPAGSDGPVRLRTHGRYPEIPGYFEDHNRPRTGMDLGRPLEALVRDLRRRFLEPYEAAFQRAVEALHGRAVAGGAREELARTLLRRFPDPRGHFVDLPREGLTVHVPLPAAGEVHAAVETRDDMAKVSLTLTGLTVDQMHRVLASLTDAGQPTPPNEP